MYENAAAHVDLLLLDGNGAAVYNAPLRLATPYLLSLGIPAGPQGCSEAFLLDLAASPDAGSPLLGAQVRFFFWVNHTHQLLLLCFWLMFSDSITESVHQRQVKLLMMFHVEEASVMQRRRWRRRGRSATQTRGRRRRSSWPTARPGSRPQTRHACRRPSGLATGTRRPWWPSQRPRSAVSCIAGTASTSR